MRKLMTAVMAMALAGALGSGAFAADTAKASKTGASTKSKAAGLHSLSGSIESYDASGHTLTVKTAKASTVFDVAADTKVWTGSKSVGMDDLSGDVGKRATVKYSEADGKKMAKSVHVAASTKAKAATKTSTTK